MSEGGRPGHAPGDSGDTGRSIIVAAVVVGLAILAAIVISHRSGSKPNVLGVTCSGQQNCRVGSLVIPGDKRVGVDVDNISLTPWRTSDFYYAPSSGAGDTYIFALDNPEEYSLDVTKQNASRSQCNDALARHPDKQTILNLHKGLMFCAAGLNFASFGLFEVTRNVGPSGILYLSEVRWRTKFD